MSGSKSKSSTSSSTSSANYDNRVAADAGAIVLSGGSSVEQLSDDVAIATIEAAVEMNSTGAALAETLNADALDTVRDVSTTAVDTVRSVTETNSNLAEDLATLVAQNANPDAQNSSTMIKYGAAAVVALAVVFLIFNRRKSS